MNDIMKLTEKMRSVVKSAKDKVVSAQASLQSTINGERVVWMNPEDLRINPDRQAFYPQRQENVDRLAMNMAEVGFDNSQPLLADQHKVTLDGHSRIMAIRIHNEQHPDNPITLVPVIIKNIANEDEARDVMIRIQTDRRQMDDGFRMGAFHKLDNIKEERKLRGESVENYSDIALAKQLNVSERLIQKMRYVLRYGTSEQVQQIEDNKLGINEAYVAIQRQLKKDKPAPTRVPKADSSHTAAPATSTASAEASSELPPKPAKDTENTLLKLTKFAVKNHIPNQDVAGYPDKILYAARVNWANIDADGCIIDADSADCCELNHLVARQ